nr:cysteine-rich and transmembrane domain-containing protein 1-like [Labrus bergylta]
MLRQPVRVLLPAVSSRYIHPSINYSSSRKESDPSRDASDRRMSDYPPPYGPHTHAYPPALDPQPPAFPGSSYQTFPQNYTGGAGGYPSGPQGAYMNQPGYQGYQSGPHGHYGEQARPNTTVVVVEQQRPREEESGAEEGFLAGCYAALCCCCLMDMLSDDHSSCDDF